MQCDPHLRAKIAAGKAAAELVQPGMLLGLGTGSTAQCFIDSLIERCKSGLQVFAVASSERSRKQAEGGGIPLLDIETVTALDLTIDGADEIDPSKRMIKGGGGALLREKIIASMSKEMIVVIDSNKIVSSLGRFPLPVEILPFASLATLTKLANLGYQGDLRKKSDGQLFKSDNGNYIVDIRLPFPCKEPEKEHERIRAIPGVLETGFFLHLAGRVVVGFPDGKVEIRQ